MLFDVHREDRPLVALYHYLVDLHPSEIMTSGRNRNGHYIRKKVACAHEKRCTGAHLFQRVLASQEWVLEPSMVIKEGAKGIPKEEIEIQGLVNLPDLIELFLGYCVV